MIKDSYGNTRFFGTYRGVVFDTNDPIGRKRLRLKVPQILGEFPTEWAWPVVAPGADVTLPSIGDGIWVQFEGGDASFPIWVGTFEGVETGLAGGTVGSAGSTGPTGPTGPAGSTGVTVANSPLSLSGPTGASLYLNVGATGGVQAWDADLDAIASLTGPTGALKKTAANTWVLDTTAVSATNIDGLSDVTITSATEGQTLLYNSSSVWVNSNPPSYNFLINGAFDIWQRISPSAPSSTSSTSGTFIADRWLHSASAGTLTVSRSTDVPVTTLPYSLSFDSSSGTTPQIQQRIEASNALPFVGQVVTFSIWAKSTAGTNALAWSTRYPTSTVDTFAATTVDQSGTFAATMTVGVWTRYSATFTVSANAVRGYSVVVSRTATTTSTTTLYAGAQLEISSVATPFRRHSPSIQGERAACQRYYYREYNTNTNHTFLVGTQRTTTEMRGYIRLPVTMRSGGQTIDSSAAATFNVINNNTSISVTAFSGTTLNETGGTFVITTASTTANFSSYLRDSVSGGGTDLTYLGFSAEL